MQDLLTVNGMVLKAEPIGEYDRRVVLLTLERGKISTFAKGARKINNRFMATTNPFCFGEFKLFEGRTAYSINEADIKNFFESFRTDMDGSLYGMYFLEVADYYTRENNDEREFLKLLYQSLRALENENLPNNLVRSVFEIKSVVVNGEFPGIMLDEEGNKLYTDAAVFAINYIVESSIEKLYTFSVTEEVFKELKDFSSRLMKKFTDKPFKSLEILDYL